jgi:ketosteroid isomerase-like protein
VALLERLRRAHRDKDAMAIAGCFTPTAVVCDLAPPLSHCGIGLAEKQSWLDSWDGPITLEPYGGSLTVDGCLAVYHGYTRISGIKRPANTLVDFWKRDTFCLRRDKADWLIAHHHTSVPLYMDGSLRPAFDLTP